jgi:carboxyl-terminal processing protease
VAALGVCLFVVTSCTAEDRVDEDAAAERGDPPISLEVADWRVEEERAYVDRALAILEEHHHATDEIDWDEVRQAAHRQLGSAPSRTRSHIAINAALTRLGGSNRLTPPATARQAAPVRFGELPTVARDGDVLTVTLPPVSLNSDTVTAYVASAFAAIRDRSEPAVCAWIVDLRDLESASLPFPLAVLGPILAGQDAVSFVRADGTATGAYAFDADGSLLDDGRPAGEAYAEDWTDDAEAWLPGGAARARQALTDHGPLPTPTPDLPVAVLTSPRTAGGGEGVVVALEGRPGTRRFGAATYGSPTGGESHDLEDGAVLYVVDSRMVDRDGERYDTRIPPDVQTADPEVDASAWLAERGCAAGE